MKRFIVASILLVAVNGGALLPPLEAYRGPLAGVSVLVAVYILIQAVLQARRGSETREAPAAEGSGTVAAAKRDVRVDVEIAHFLGILQEKGRFLDFVMDDITSYNNEQVGAAARVVHQGCSKVMSEYFTITPLHQGQEGDVVELKPGYNPAEYRPAGKLADGAQIRGKIVHRGWKATEVNLPRLAETAAASDKGFVISPAEVEVK